MPVLWDGGSVCAEAAAASYLAVHEFQVDSFQRDLQQAALPGLHVLHRELSAQLRTCTETRPRVREPADKMCQPTGERAFIWMRLLCNFTSLRQTD